MAGLVAVIDTNINTHEQQIQNLYLKRHWAVNARRPLSYTMAVKLMSAVSQNITPAIKAA